jgi:DNA-binding MarR family transcriptional regulator
MRVIKRTQLTDDERAWETLVIAYNTLERARELELARVGLTISQAGILYYLKTAEEPLTPMKLSNRAHRQPHTVGALVKRMEAQGLVKTSKDLRRKNWVRVSLTKKGEEAFKRQVTEKTVRNATSCLSKEERDALIAICHKLRARGVELIRQIRPSPYDQAPFP